jgi:hypothetical protein
MKSSAVLPLHLCGQVVAPKSKLHLIFAPHVYELVQYAFISGVFHTHALDENVPK